jgi:hypothetical protein
MDLVLLIWNQRDPDGPNSSRLVETPVANLLQVVLVLCTLNRRPLQLLIRTTKQFAARLAVFVPTHRYRSAGSRAILICTHCLCDIRKQCKLSIEPIGPSLQLELISLR